MGAGGYQDRKCNKASAPLLRYISASVIKPSVNFDVHSKGSRALTSVPLNIELQKEVAVSTAEKSLSLLMKIQR